MLFLFVASIYVLTGSRSTISLDVWTADLSSWRIATTGSPSLEGHHEPALEDNPLESVWVLESADGHAVVGRSPGVVAAALPAYWIAQPSSMTIVPAMVTAAVLTATAVLLMYLCLLTRMSRRSSALAALLFGLTTPVWSISANGMWPHTLTVLGIAGMAFAASRERWWLVGVFGGVALWGRLHAAVIVALLALIVAVIQRRPRVVIEAGLVSAAWLGLSCIWNHWVYGSWSPMAAYEVSKFVNQAADQPVNIVNQLGFWVSPDRGILVWTPLLLLLTPALVRGWRQLPDWSRALILAGFAYSLVQTVLNRFSGGDTFYGYRLGLEFLTCATPAFALSAERMGTWARRLFAPIATLQLAMILPGAVNESFFVAADEVWTNNAFVNVIVANPLVYPVVLLLIGLASILAARIWANPELERPTASRQGSA
jgi:hypothetical protein